MRQGTTSNEQKQCVCLFTCASMGAFHLERVPNLADGLDNTSIFGAKSILINKYAGLLTQ